MIAVELEQLIEHIREYRGVMRKAPITPVAAGLIPARNEEVLAAYGEDAAVIKCGREILLMAADGILEDLVVKNPFWAGYCSVLVNVNDIAAMGGVPVAMVNVISTSDGEIRTRIVEGMRAACEKFGVPMVGGHTHPDTTYSAVDVAVLGKTDRSRLVLSSGASEGEPIIFAMDLDGEFTEGVPYSWDTTSKKSGQAVRRRLMTMNKVAPYLTSGKDISNPGALGSLGMLLEASGKGGLVDITKIPRPAAVDLQRWLTAYQGCGFVLTCRPAKVKTVVDEFARADLTAAVCGEVRAGSLLEVELEGRRGTLFDFSSDSLGCSLPKGL